MAECSNANTAVGAPPTRTVHPKDKHPGRYI